MKNENNPIWHSFINLWSFSSLSVWTPMYVHQVRDNQHIKTYAISMMSEALLGKLALGMINIIVWRAYLVISFPVLYDEISGRILFMEYPIMIPKYHKQLFSSSHSSREVEAHFFVMTIWIVSHHGLYLQYFCYA